MRRLASVPAQGMQGNPASVYVLHSHAVCPTHAQYPPPQCAQVRLLVREGGADISVRDRWGYTPLDEARRVGATPVIQVSSVAVRVRVRVRWEDAFS